MTNIPVTNTPVTNKPCTEGIKPEFEPYAQSIDGLRKAGEQFWTRGWSLGTSSNYSAVVSRDPLQLLVTASGKDKGHLGVNDFVIVDEFGKPTFPGQPKSSAETLLHCLAAKNGAAARRATRGFKRSENSAGNRRMGSADLSRSAVACTIARLAARAGRSI